MIKFRVASSSVASLRNHLEQGHIAPISGISPESDSSLFKAESSRCHPEMPLTSARLQLKGGDTLSAAALGDKTGDGGASQTAFIDSQLMNLLMFSLDRKRMSC